MKCKIINSNDYKNHNICSEINKIIIKFNIDINYFLNLVNIACFDDAGSIIYIYYNKKNIFTLLIESKIEEAYLFVVKHIIGTNLNNLSLIFNLLKTGIEIPLDENNLFTLFNLYNWPIGEKGKEQIYKISLFSDILKERVFSKKISIKEAIYFHDYFKNNYDKFLKLIPDNLSFSQNNQLLRYVAEYSKINGKGIDLIIKIIKNNKVKDLLSYFYGLRYPKYNDYKEKIENYINKLLFSKEAKINYQKNFESEKYDMVINFRNINELKNKLEKIDRSLKNINEKDDIFIHKNLFKD